ncbi:targeting protein for Xklp2 isoform X3 [Trichosurus vulpecula]|uniref:targeting protein for Xklp2 isoform X3 n=1 Tax=Trichosurus vulpecula TaxID=9337 RepID=UPI00186B490C|nr:targeting protein for Xklp2 isoform X3 [Trichosurus vulpecula]
MSQSKASYTFDAPTAFINFTSLNNEDIYNVDSWFEERANLENKPPEDEAPGTSYRKTPLRKAHVPQAVVMPLRSVGNTYVETENPSEESAPSNACNSPGFQETMSKNTPALGSFVPGQSQRVTRNLSAQKKSAQRQKYQLRTKAERHLVPAVSDEMPPSKKMKVTEGKSKSIEGSASKNGGQKSVPSLGRPADRTAVSCTPPIRKKVLKSTEEQELEKRLKMQQEVAEMRRKNEESLKIALAGQPLKKTVSQVTKSVDFHFHTDDRIKQHPKSQEEYKEVDFTSELRKHPPSPARVGKGPTIAKPFNLSQGKKRPFEETSSAYVPLAQQVEAFHKRTPSRYHLRSKKDDEGLLPSKPSVLKITNPQTPVFKTKQRTRPVTCKSTAELEAEELEKIQQYKFRARELDSRILEGGPILPKKPPVKPPTQAIGFDLEIEKRIQEREAKKKTEEDHFEFHSRPCPTRILEDVVGIPEKKKLPTTIPKSPAFALKNRVRVFTREDEEEEEPTGIIKSNPMPHYGVPFKPRIPEQRTVEVCPFSFDSRDKERQLQKEKKVKELQKIEEQVPKFKAQPLPQFDTVSLPEKKVKTLTQLEPFHLQTDERGALKAQTWKQQLEEDLKQQKEAACFKARPNTVIHQEPFVPKKEKKPASVQEPFQLATERRARERQEFEKQVAEVEAQKAQKLEEARQREEERKKEELAKLRQELVHKANPIRRYQGVEVKPSDQPLTLPVSPKFSTRFQC